MTDKRELKYHAIAYLSEATEGTDPISGTPSLFRRKLGDGHAIDPKHTFVPDESVGGIHDRPAGQSLGSHNDVVFEEYLFGKEIAAGDPALQADLFGMAGWDEVITASTDSVYTLTTFHTTAIAPPGTVYERRWYTDAEYRESVSSAVRGNLKLTFEHEKYAKVAFTGKGPFAEIGSSTTAGSPPTSYNSDKKAMLVKGITATLDATVYKIKALDIDTMWDIAEDRDSHGTSGLRQVELVRTKAPAGSISTSDVALLEAVIAANAADTVVTVEVELSDGTDTVTLDMDIQFGQKNRTGGPIGSYAFPFEVVGSPSITFT